MQKIRFFRVYPFTEKKFVHFLFFKDFEFSLDKFFEIFFFRYSASFHSFHKIHYREKVLNLAKHKKYAKHKKIFAKFSIFLLETID